MTGISVVIPTFDRDHILLNTIDSILNLSCPPNEILIIDQTPHHLPEVERGLMALAQQSRIRWIRLSEPLIPRAMNVGLLKSREAIVLFLDDDIIPEEGLVSGHLLAHEAYQTRVVAGRIVQPWTLEAKDGRFLFDSLASGWITDLMAGNFSIQRDFALDVGGFDESFVRAAYRFETEFAERILERGERIRFEPAASILHLKAQKGGTRAFGDHRRTLSPGHAVGGYYYIFRSSRVKNRAGKIVRRLVRSIWTKHHRVRPWWIPGTLISELAGLIWATTLRMRAPRRICREMDPLCEDVSRKRES